MLKHIEEFGKSVVIAGLRDAKIENLEEFLKRLRREKSFDVEIQFFDAQFIADWQHLYFAVLNALTAFKSGRNVSKNLAIETILYASAQHQIKKALENLGIKPKTSQIALVIIGERAETLKSMLNAILREASAERDDQVLELTEEKMENIRKIFGISDLELETVMKRGNLKKALIDIVIERMALLATQT
jgi:tRNA threonylcarbamoyladenosine modification (KEOPS) complex Cgi121 subunit